MITGAWQPGRLHPKSAKADQANTARRKLIIEWITQV
jgi:hypothetical protein